MAEISVVAKNRSSFNGIDITPDTTELTGLKINTWTPPTGASYGLYISPLTGTTAKSLYLGNSIDIKNGTGTITLSVPPSTSAGYTANSTHTVYLPTTGGTLITSDQAANLVSAGGSTTATDLRPLDNLWTNKNTFQRTVAASLTITNATYNTLPKTYALNVEIGNDSTTDPTSFALAGTANTYYVATAQMRPIPLSLAANVTVTEASTLHIMGAPSKSGATGTAVNAYGLKISDSNTYASVPASGFTNGYGLYIIQPSEAINNYALALAADNSGTNFIARFYADKNARGTGYADSIVAEFGGGNLSATLFSFLGTTANFSIASGGTANLFTGTGNKTINIGTGATANSASIAIGSNAGTQGSTSVYAGTTLTLTPVSTTVATSTSIATNPTVAGQTKTINIGTAGAAGSITNMRFGSQVVGSTSNFTFGIASALRGSTSAVAKGVFAFGTSSFGAVAGSSQYSIYNLAGMSNHPWDATTIGPDSVRTALLTNFSGLESVYTKSITTANTWVMGDGTSSIYIPPNSNCSMTIVIAANASSKGEWWEPISWKDLTSTDFTMNRNGTTSFVKSGSSSEFNPTTGGSAGVMWRHGVYGLSTHWQSPPAIEANIGYANSGTYPKKIHFKSKAIPSAKNITTAQGTFASGAATITLSPGNTDVAVGMFVGHVSIPTGTKVAGVNVNGTSITIDQNTTAAVTSAATILFGSDNRYSKENSIAIAPSSSFYGDAPIRIKENTVLRFPMFEGRFNVRRDPAENNGGNEGNQYNGPVFLGTLPTAFGGYTTNYDPYIKYHSGFAAEDNANFGHAGGQWILKGNATINASNLSIMNILQESFSGSMREGTTIGISTSYAATVPFIAITVKNRQPQKVSAFLGTGIISRATGTTSEYRLSVVSTTSDAIRMEIPSMLAVPSTPTYTNLTSYTSTFSVTFSVIQIKKFGSIATKNRFVATITRTSSTGTPSVSEVHTITAAGYIMTFSMPAFNWLTPGQILEVPGFPDGILVKLSDLDTSLWASSSLNPQSVDYSNYYYTYPTVFNLDTVDPFWGVVGTTSSATANSTGTIEFAAYNVAAVKYSATAHVTEVR